MAPLAHPRNMNYSPAPQGSREAREAVGQYYERNKYSVKPQQVFLTASTSEAYSFLFRLLADYRDAILFPRPSYPLFEFLVGLNDLQMETYPLLWDAGSHSWKIDLNALRDAIHSRTRSIVLVNPNNPTGSFVRREELQEINAMCREHQLSLICDEVFLDYHFDDNAQDRISLVQNKDNLTFVLGGISKCLALPQMKVSWVVVNGPDELTKIAMERLEVITDTYLSVNAPAQNALKEWLSFQPSMREAICRRLKENQKFLIDHSRESICGEYLHSSGGWYAIVKLPACLTEEAWVLEFLKEDKVFVHPGYFFDFLEEPYIVISLLPPPAVFQEGIRRIFARIQAKG